MTEYLEKAILVSIEAGKAIMDIYHSADFGVEMKSDNSPLTLADRASHNIIVKELKSSFPGIPILSEEGSDIPYGERKNWKQFWLVDPLDGTKEFIKKNDEFTVNIALIENNVPTLGVIYAPALEGESIEIRIQKSEVRSQKLEDGNNDQVADGSEVKGFDIPSGTLYFAQNGFGAFMQMKNGNPVRLFVNKDTSNGIIAVRSRSHASPEEEKVFEQYGVTETISGGSSIKFCRVADGSAHIYYRYGPTNEWDVGAGYAIAKIAGATVEGLRFNKENLLNGSFMVKSI